MLSNAFSLAIATTAGFWIVYKKLPNKVKAQIIRFGLIADLVALIGTYLLLGGTLTALMSGALVGLFTSVLLHVANNKEEFEYLYDAADFIKDKLGEVKNFLSAYGKSYREKKQGLPA